MRVKEQRLPARRAFEHVLDGIEQAIHDGSLAAGDRLPPERELAERFGVSRTSAREAVRVLETFGLVSVRRGAEHGATLREQPENALAALLRLQVALEHVTIADLVEFRIATEGWAVAGAAARRQPQALEAARAALAGMRGDPVPDAFLALDLEFHLALAAASGNPLAATLLEACRSAIERAMLEGVQAVGDWPAARARLVGEHAALLDAVSAGDPGRASALAQEHLRSFYRETLGLPLTAPGDRGAVH